MEQNITNYNQTIWDFRNILNLLTTLINFVLKLFKIIMLKIKNNVKTNI